MQGATAGIPPTDFPNVVPLEQLAGGHHINVDTPDTAPTEDEPAAPKEKPPSPSPPTKPGWGNQIFRPLRSSAIVTACFERGPSRRDGVGARALLVSTEPALVVR